MVTLVKNGFSHHQVLNELTYKQVSAYYGICREQEQKTLHHHMNGTRAAFHADKNEYEKITKGIM